jgi:hypothetical protein
LLRNHRTGHNFLWRCFFCHTLALQLLTGWK